MIPDECPRSGLPVAARLFLCAGGLAFLAGCADLSGIAPKAQLASVEQVAAARLSAAPAAAGDAWWAAWGDPQLDRLVAQALAGNPGLKAVRARAEAAAAVAGMARSETRPELALDARSYRQRYSANQFFPPPIGGSVYWNNEAVFGLGYDLDLWGQKESRLAAALDRVHVAEAEVRQVRIELVAALAAAYAQLAAHYELADIARAEQSRLETNLTIAQRRQRAGLGTGREADAVSEALARQQARVEALASDIVLDRHLLAALAGLGPQAGDDIARPQLAGQGGLDLPASLPADLVGRRPDLIARRWQVEAAGQDIAAAKADFYPNINLLAFVGVQSLAFSNLLASGSAMYGAGPALSLPLFDGGRRRSRLSHETAAYDAAVEDYNAGLVDALREVADRLERLQRNGHELETYRAALAAAEHRLAAAQKALRAGLVPEQAEIDARAAVLADRETLAGLEGERRVAYAGLVLAAGGDLGGPAAGARQ
ncbi:efflux transporter outer membrane subunit [Parasulfuritortus cantonensis]|nr:efflux transporter outer membrane subunit [Parasulfuritortus cantonensis]